MNTKRPVVENTDMPITRKGLWTLLAGVLVMLAGFILLAGGGLKDPDHFNEAMFDFRRLVAAPLVIACGLVIDVVAIMRRPRSGGKAPQKEDGR